MDPYDLDAIPSSYSPQERLAVQNVFEVVREDYSPFRINVTTAEPGSFADRVAFRQVVTSSDGSFLSVNLLGIAVSSSYATTKYGAFDNVAFTIAPAFGSHDAGSSGQIIAAASGKHVVS